MKVHIIKLFDYDSYANELILKSILAMNAPEKPLQLMAHLLAAQQIWLNRCKSLVAAEVVLWPDWKANTFEPIIYKNHLNWVDFVNNLDQKDFDETIQYKNSKGENFQNQLSDVLAHVINHGTNHRTQIGNT